MQAYGWVSLTATITNIGSGPVVDSFDTMFSANGVTIGSITTDAVMLPGASVQATRSWRYPGGDPSIIVDADSGMSVTETIESNNQLQRMLSTVADISAPALIGHSPADNSELQSVEQISFTLSDTQSAINDAAVMASFTLSNSAQQTMGGIINESNDTFTYIPEGLPLAQDTYTASLTAVDNYGNTQPYSFSFVIDTTPPAKPVITGGIIASGTIQPRPASNTADRVVFTLEGTREANTSIWVNGQLQVPNSSAQWSCTLTVNPGQNEFEVHSQDLAGNSSPLEWVDINFTGQGGIVYQYDASGRLKKVLSLP